MKPGLVVGPTLGALAEFDDVADAAVVRVRSVAETTAERTAGLRALFAEGVDTILAVDRAVPVRADWLEAGVEFAVVADHLNLTDDNPLVGPNDEAWGPRFPDMTDAWAPVLREAVREAATDAGSQVVEGVVAGVHGPGRTGAELEMLRMAGADMASEGFVYEAIVTRHAGRRIAGLALLSIATGLPGEIEGLGAIVLSALRAIDGAPVDA